MNVPRRPASSSSSVTTNALVRSRTWVVAAMSAIGNRNATSATRLTDRPSTPRW